MIAHDEAVLELGPATQPSTYKQRRLACFVAVVLVAIFAIMLPFAHEPLPRFDAFIPSLETLVFSVAIANSVMFYSKFSIYRSRPMLVLASGYLFVGLIVIPHLLNFPGAFAPNGLFGDSKQSFVWLYRCWHFGFSLALATYVRLINVDAGNVATPISNPRATAWSIAIVFGVTCACVWATTFVDYPPSISSWGVSMPVATLTLSIYALVALWKRRKTSVLNLWLLVVALIEILEVIRGSLLNPGVLYSVGFYVGRTLSTFGSVIVLAVLLSEFEGLYALLANSNLLLKRERANKLMNLEAMAASISHEVRQPLSAVVTDGGAAKRWLRRAPPNLDEAESALDRMVAASHRAAEVLDNIRALFGRTDQGQETVDVNEIAVGVLHILRGELEEHGITTRTELTPQLPLIVGHKGQLQEVIINLVRNAIEAMDANDGSRVLRVSSEHHDRDAITVAVEDTGPGIDPKKLDGIFDAFVSTKSKGMGLGLAICRMIVERHEGQLTAWSDKKKGGALFQFTLPIKPAGSVPAPA